jgi:site-specific recombinase XerD
MTLSFVCRASKARKDGKSPIELSIIINGIRSIIALDRKIPYNKFNPKTQTVRGDKEINEYLDVIRRKCFTIETELIKIDKLDIDTFIHSFKYGVPEKQDTLLKVYDKHNELYRQNVEVGKTKDTAYYKYIRNRERLAEYLLSLGKEDIKLKDITPSFVENFQNFCLKTLKVNTTNKELKKLKRILEFAVKERYIDVNPFRLTLREEKIEYDVLSKDDIDFLLKFDIREDRLNKVRDCFIFQCYTGLAYSDMAQLTKDDITDDVIIKRRQKTDIQYVVPLLPVAKNILEKYDYQLPIISNQKYNQWLKFLGEITGIGKSLHSHLARHSFACLLLNSGVDMKTISRTLGHSSMKTTERVYAEMSNDTVVDNIRKALN